MGKAQSFFVVAERQPDLRTLTQHEIINVCSTSMVSASHMVTWPWLADSLPPVWQRREQQQVHNVDTTMVRAGAETQSTSDYNDGSSNCPCVLKPPNKSRANNSLHESLLAAFGCNIAKEQLGCEVRHLGTPASMATTSQPGS